MIKTMLLKKAVTLSLAGSLAVAPIIVARANPGKFFVQAGGLASGTLDTPETPDIPDIPDTPNTPDKPPVNPGGGGWSSGGSSDSGGSETVTGTNNTAKTVVNNTVVIGGTKVQSTIAGQYRASSVAGAVVVTPLAEVNTAVGVVNGEKAYAKIGDSLCGADSKASMEGMVAILNNSTPGVIAGPMLDIWMGKTSMAGVYTNVTKTLQPVKFTIGIPQSFKTEGYDMALIRVQEGGKVTVIADTDNDPNTITFATDEFGTFTLVKGPAGSFAAFK